MTENILGTFFEKDDGKTYTVNEGALTINEGFSCVNGNKQKFMNFNSEVKPENFLEFESGKDLTVKGATTKATHICMYEPEFPAGNLPQTVPTGCDYRRHVTAYRFKVGEGTLPLKATNQSITAGDKLGITTYDGGLDKDTSSSATNACIALESKAANAGGYILVELNEHYVPFISS